MARTASAAPKKNSTRQTLIDAAHGLIWANSYAHVSVEDICRAAGVQKGSFYHFFPTKADLAAAALEDHWASKEPMIEAMFAENKTPQAQLRALCEGILARQKESLEETGKVCGCPYATVGAEMSGNNEALFALSQKMSDRFLGFYERMLKNAVDAKLIPAAGIKQRAQEMQTYGIGAMLHARMTNTLAPVGKSLETALFRISGLDATAKKATPVAKLVKKR